MISTLARPVIAPITESLAVPEPPVRMVCFFCKVPVDIVCERGDANDACICEVCLSKGKGAWMEHCPCPACTALIQEIRALTRSI